MILYLENLNPIIFISFCPRTFLETRPFIWNNYELSRITITLLILQWRRYVWSRLEKNLRNGITKTVRSRSNCWRKWELMAWLQYMITLAEESEQNRKPPISRDYLLDIYDTFYPENLRIFVSRFNGKIVGGTINICYKQNFLLDRFS